MKKTSKFKIQGTISFRDCPDSAEPKSAKLTNCPKWLKRYKFFTHRHLDGGERNFNLTEMRTGLAIVLGLKSRKSAIKSGISKMANVGRIKFQSAHKKGLKWKQQIINKL